MERDMYSNKKVVALKINQLTRHTDKKVVAIMENLRIHLNESMSDVEKTNGALSDMRTLMNRKIVVGTLSSLANIALAVMLVLLRYTLIAPLAGVLPLRSSIFHSTAYPAGCMAYKKSVPFATKRGRLS